MVITCGGGGGGGVELRGAARLLSVREVMTAGFGGARADSGGLRVLVLDMKDRKPFGLLPGLQRMRNISTNITFSHQDYKLSHGCV